MPKMSSIWYRVSLIHSALNDFAQLMKRLKLLHEVTLLGKNSSHGLLQKDNSCFTFMYSLLVISILIYYIINF